MEEVDLYRLKGGVLLPKHGFDYPVELICRKCQNDTPSSSSIYSFAFKKVTHYIMEISKTLSDVAA
jgi:hypothetical protein